LRCSVSEVEGNLRCFGHRDDVAAPIGIDLHRRDRVADVRPARLDDSREARTASSPPIAVTVPSGSKAWR
jgi:hypothetical protein